MVTNFANNEQSIVIDSDVVRWHSLSYAILLDRIRLFYNYDHLNTTPEEPYCINIDEMSDARWIEKENFKNEYEAIAIDCELHSSREWDDWNFYFFF